MLALSPLTTKLETWDFLVAFDSNEGWNDRQVGTCFNLFHGFVFDSPPARTPS